MVSRGDNSSKTLDDGNQGASPSDKTDPKSCGRELDDESIGELVGFFRLLDKWERERQEEKSRKSGGDSQKDDPQDSKNNPKNLGQ